MVLLDYGDLVKKKLKSPQSERFDFSGDGGNWPRLSLRSGWPPPRVPSAHAPVFNSARKISSCLARPTHQNKTASYGGFVFLRGDGGN